MNILGLTPASVAKSAENTGILAEESSIGFTK
jgi:hypothetical protein